MAVDNETLKAEVRVLTEYDSSLISDADLLSLIEIAKSELLAEIGDSSIVFFGGNPRAERALFWLTCLFVKVKAGEIDAPNISISEIQVRHQSMGERGSFWLDNFNKQLSSLTAESMVGHVKGGRSDRTYAFDN